MENQGYGQAAPGTGYTSATHPTNPNMAGAAPEKRGIADKVRGMLGGHGHNNTDAAAAHHQPAVYGDATPATGTAESTRVGCLDKLKAKTGVGHGLAPAQTKAQGGGLTGHHTGGANTDPSASPDFNGGTNVNSSAAVHGGWPHPTNPNETAGMGDHYNRETHNHPTGLANPSSEPHHNRETHNHPTGLPNPFSQQNPNAGYAGVHDTNLNGGYAGAQPTNPNAGYGGGQPTNPNAGYGGGQPTNPTGVTNSQGGAVLGDPQGNVHEGPRDDNEKKEGFVSKIMDKLHSPKGQPANTTTTTTPNTY